MKKIKVIAKSNILGSSVQNSTTKDSKAENYGPRKEKIPAKDMHSALTGGKAPFVEKGFIAAKSGPSASAGYHQKQVK